ncbi:hypothetical protein B9S53_17090 [Arthrospira sp. O9.13F]|nr:hypothetical protein B9S53_17090 [Arthrospira sp. O9.13F]
MLRVDIGCGTNKPENFLGVDIYPAPGVDIVADISQNFPFNDSSVDELRAYDIIEHLPDRINTMNEIWRVCKQVLLLIFLSLLQMEEEHFKTQHILVFGTLILFFTIVLSFPRI